MEKPESLMEEKAYCHTYDSLVEELSSRMEIDDEKILPKEGDSFDYEDINSWISAVDFKEGKVPNLEAGFSTEEGKNPIIISVREQEMIRSADEKVSNESLLYSMALAEAKMKVISDIAEDTYPPVVSQISDYRKEMEKIREEILGSKETNNSLNEILGKTSARSGLLVSALVVTGLICSACGYTPIGKSVLKTGMAMSSQPEVTLTSPVNETSVSKTEIPFQPEVTLTSPATEIPFVEATKIPYSYLAEHLISDRGFVEKLSVEKPIFALTIDDGYSKGSMEEMLNILDQNDVNVTFFIIGDAARITLGPELLKRAVEEGNEICYHSMKHNQEAIVNWTKDDWVKDYEDWEVLMKEMLGEELYYMGVKNYARAPGGLFNNAFLAMAREKELIPFGWNTSPQYWDRGVRPKGGDILIIHVGQGDIGNLEKDINLENIKPVTISELVDEYLASLKED